MNIVERIKSFANKDRNVSTEGNTKDINDFFEFAKSNYKFRILAVDDDEINLRILSNFMKIEGLETEEVTNPLEALKRMSEKKYDLVLLDIMMPVMSGFEVCQNIRKEYSMYELPVLMLTAKQGISDIVKGLNCGANDYIVKPFEMEELIRRIRNLLVLKYSVEMTIDATKQLEEEKYKNILLKKVRNFENMISITYAEKNQDKAISIMVAVTLTAFENIFHKASYYEYDKNNSIFSMNAAITNYEIEDIKEMIVSGFLENMDKVYNRIKNSLVTVQKKEIKNSEKRMIEIMMSKKIKLFCNIRRDNFSILDKQTNSIAIIAVEYNENRYGTILLESEKEILGTQLTEELKVFSESFALYLEKQKLEKEKIESQKSKDFRCSKCNRKLFTYKEKVSFIEIKCPKCDNICTS